MLCLDYLHLFCNENACAVHVHSVIYRIQMHVEYRQALLALNLVYKIKQNVVKQYREGIDLGCEVKEKLCIAIKIQETLEIRNRSLLVSATQLTYNS